MRGRSWLILMVGLLWPCGAALSAQTGAHPDRRIHSLGDFRFESGAVLPKASIAYVTHGELRSGGRNAVLLPSGFRATHHGYDFLIGPGQALDSARYFIIATEMFGSGGSSSPSNTPAPFDGPRFPPVSIRDNVAATRRLLAEKLGVNHLKAIIGFSMGAQQAFQWAVSHPDFMERIVPYCGTAKTYPHTFVMLEGAIRAYYADAAFQDGEYKSLPIKAMVAVHTHWLGWVYSQEWWRREKFKPHYTTAQEVVSGWAADTLYRDPNDEIAQMKAWQVFNIGHTPGFGGDHRAALRSIKAEVLYMPCETDLYFPIGDIKYEAGFIPDVEVVPIRSLWGHFAGLGINAEDNTFIDAQIRRFLK